MGMKTFDGIIVAVYNAFSQDGKDLITANIPQYSKYVASSGIDGVLVNGTNGEGMSMTTSERASATEAWITAGHTDKLHVMVNVGGTNIKDAQHLAKHAESCGADSLLTPPELYYKPQSVKEVVEWIKAIADAAPSTPIFYYYSKRSTTFDLDLIELLKQAGKEIPTFSGLKYADGDLLKGAPVANFDPERFTVFFAIDEVLLGAYLLGFKSANNASANVFPELNRELRAAVKEGRLDDARKTQKELTKAVTSIIQHGNEFACYKAATEIVSGLPLGPTRFPISPLDTHTKDKIRDTLKKLGAI